jgi:hypothetical protein
LHRVLVEVIKVRGKDRVTKILQTPVAIRDKDKGRVIVEVKADHPEVAPEVDPLVEEDLPLVVEGDLPVQVPEVLVTLVRPLVAQLPNSQLVILSQLRLVNYPMIWRSKRR